MFCRLFQPCFSWLHNVFVRAKGFSWLQWPFCICFFTIISRLHLIPEIPCSQGLCGKCRPSLRKATLLNKNRECSTYLLIHSNCPLSSLEDSQRLSSRSWTSHSCLFSVHVRQHHSDRIFSLFIAFCVLFHFSSSSYLYFSSFPVPSPLHSRFHNSLVLNLFHSLLKNPTAEQVVVGVPWLSLESDIQKRWMQSRYSVLPAVVWSCLILGRHLH